MDTYEKKYKNLVKAVKELQEANPSDEGIQNWVKDNVPELAESEDERIRKWIIDDIKYNMDNEPLNNSEYKKQAKKAIAWLENQGDIDKSSYEIAEKEKRGFVGDGFIKCCANFQDFKEGETYWLEYVGNDSYNVRSDNLLGKTYHITPCQLYTIFKKLTWLEKQDKQKLSTIDVDEMVDDYANNKECGNEIFGKPVPCMIRAYKQGIIDAIKKVVLKPTWSEEDEYLLDETVQHLEELIRIDKAKHCGCDVQYYQRDIDWLKSIKDKYIWKPSDEHIGALEDAMYQVGILTPLGSKINDLCEHLRKLTE